jgi:dTDP-4-amino-4,6-dideoxygalactose transaminase
VFDPVSALRLEPVFYRMDGHLNLDLEHFASQVINQRPKAALLIHYFGRVDPSAPDACAIARANGVPLIEDAAHALFTVMVTGDAGQLGDATILSLHKMLPVPTGGALLCRPCRAPRSSPGDVSALFEYDLAGISACRLTNAQRVVDLVRPLAGSIDLLWPSWLPGHIPHTVPVILRNCNRYEVYQRMNALGFGVVSLYHTLIEQISRREYPMSYEIADRILNLPVHQDVPSECLAPMVETLREVVGAP